MSYIEGAFYALMVGTAETFALFYAVKSQLTTSQIAMLSTLPILLGALAQWIVPNRIPNTSLKNAMLGFMGVQILGLCGLLYSFHTTHIYECLLLALSAYWIGGLVCGPLWLDWISAWLGPAAFCRYLSRRNGFVSLLTLVGYLGAALVIYRSQSLEIFQVAFSIGIVARCCSWVTMFFQPSAAISRHSAQSPTVVPNHSESRVIFWVMTFTVIFKFAVNIASPFFLPYMVNELKFSLLTYVLLTAVPFVGRSLFLASWGEAARSIRPLIGLPITMVGIAVGPVLWTFTQRVEFLTLFEFASGLLWGGFDLCAVLIVQNFWAGNARKFLGMHLALMSLASLLGASLGAELLHSGFSYMDLYLFSSNIRILNALLFILILTRFATTRTSLRVYGDFLSTVLSIRPSFANIGRLIPVRRRKIWNEPVNQNTRH